MKPDWIAEAEQTARRYPVVPSLAVLRLIGFLELVLGDREKLAADLHHTETRLRELQESLSRIIRQLQDCRDTEAAVLRVVTEAQDRRAGETDAG